MGGSGEDDDPPDFLSPFKLHHLLLVEVLKSLLMRIIPADVVGNVK